MNNANGRPSRKRKRLPTDSTIQPDLNWAVASKFAYSRKGVWLPLIVEFNHNVAVGRTAFQQWQWFVRLTWLPLRFRRSVTLPALLRDLPNAVFRGKPLRICVLLVAMEDVAALVTDSIWKATVLRAEMGVPLPLDLEATSVDTWPEPVEERLGRPIRRVLMGVIDQGIAFAHQRFRNGIGTRIEWVWQQDVNPTPISRSAIDAALSTAIGDEDGVYRRIGQLSFRLDGYKPLARRKAHGTQVLDLMAGQDQVLDERNRPIIAVDMPEEGVGDPASSKLTSYVIPGLVFILAQASSLRQPNETLPVVVNLSYGPQEGPHDGSEMLETFMDTLVEAFKDSVTPLTLVIAAGNFRQKRTHSESALDPGELSLSWRLQPASRAPSSMKIWIEGGLPGKTEVQLTSPTGETIRVSSVAPQDKWPQTGLPMMQAEYTSGSRDNVWLYVAPTETDLESSVAHPVAPSGAWTVCVRNKASSSVHVHTWIRRGDTQAGRRLKGRQSRLESDSYARFAENGRPLDFDGTTVASDVRRLSTLSGISTGAHTFVVGGYVRSIDFPAPYSSLGPDLNSKRGTRAPNWATPSDDSVSCRGVLAAGTRSGAVAAIGGTSAAAPQSARWLADLWMQQQDHPQPPASLKQPASFRERPMSGSEKKAAVGKGLVETPQYCPFGLKRLPRP